jgi:muramoyltetrapeptide carboxypeptidase LdcA involved in peptidoglycan recycling
MIRQQTTPPGQRKPPRSLQQEFAHALYKDHQQQQQQQQQVTGEMILDQPLFMCDPKLNRQGAADRMAQWLPQLHPELWWGRLPTLYLSSSTRLEEDRAKGILILHDDMTLEGKISRMHGPFFTD